MKENDFNLNEDAFSFIQMLLHKNPAKRLGSRLNGLADIKSHPFFNGIDWEQVYNKQIKPQYIPSLNAQREFRYFPHKILNDPKAELNSSFSTLDKSLSLDVSSLNNSKDTWRFSFVRA